MNPAAGIQVLCFNVCQLSRLVLQAQKPVQVTCPFGTLDPLMDRAHLVAFPVPSGLLQGTTELHTDAQRNGLDATHYGQSFCSDAFKGNAAVLLAAAQRQVNAVMWLDLVNALMRLHDSDLQDCVFYVVLFCAALLSKLLVTISVCLVQPW